MKKNFMERRGAHGEPGHRPENPFVGKPGERSKAAGESPAARAPEAQARVGHLREAAEHLAAAGFRREAEHFEAEAKKIQGSGAPKPEGASRTDSPPDSPPASRSASRSDSAPASRSASRSDSAPASRSASPAGPGGGPPDMARRLEALEKSVQSLAKQLEAVGDGLKRRDP